MLGECFVTDANTEPDLFLSCFSFNFLLLQGLALCPRLSLSSHFTFAASPRAGTIDVDHYA